jgi:hypothetical protein
VGFSSDQEFRSLFFLPIFFPRNLRHNEHGGREGGTTTLTLGLRWVWKSDGVGRLAWVSCSHMSACVSMSEYVRIYIDWHGFLVCTRCTQVHTCTCILKVPLSHYSHSRHHLASWICTRFLSRTKSYPCPMIFWISRIIYQRVFRSSEVWSNVLMPRLGSAERLDLLTFCVLKCPVARGVWQLHNHQCFGSGFERE